MRQPRQGRPHQHSVHDTRPQPQLQHNEVILDGRRNHRGPQDHQPGATQEHTKPHSTESRQLAVPGMESTRLPRARANRDEHARARAAPSERHSAAAAAARVRPATACVSASEHDAAPGTSNAADAANGAARDGQHGDGAADDAAA